MDWEYSYRSFIPDGCTISNVESKTSRIQGVNGRPLSKTLLKTFTCSDGTIIKVEKYYESEESQDFAYNPPRTKYTEELWSVSITVNGRNKLALEIVCGDIMKEFIFNADGSITKHKYDEISVPYDDDDTEEVDCIEQA